MAAFRKDRSGRLDLIDCSAFGGLETESGKAVKLRLVLRLDGGLEIRSALFGAIAKVFRRDGGLETCDAFMRKGGTSVPPRWRLREIDQFDAWNQDKCSAAMAA